MMMAAMAMQQKKAITSRTMPPVQARRQSLLLPQ
jgi:hypothetical protein